MDLIPRSLEITGDGFTTEWFLSATLRQIFRLTDAGENSLSLENTQTVTGIRFAVALAKGEKLTVWYYED